jgi:GNAT superfamily N-acetyltransferase
VDFEVRISRPEDLAGVQDLNHALFEHDRPYDNHLKMSWPYDRDTGAAYFSERVSGRAGICFVANSNGALIGYLAGNLHAIESYREGRRAELENMFVAERARRAGVGTALVSRFRTWCEEQGADELYVSAYFGNNDAVEFYRRCGFTSWGHALVLDQRPDKN